MLLHCCPSPQSPSLCTLYNGYNFTEALSQYTTGLPGKFFSFRLHIIDALAVKSPISESAELAQWALYYSELRPRSYGFLYRFENCDIFFCITTAFLEKNIRNYNNNSCTMQKKEPKGRTLQCVRRSVPKVPSKSPWCTVSYFESVFHADTENAIILPETPCCFSVFHLRILLLASVQI
jgi:hypothetical protein